MEAAIKDFCQDVNNTLATAGLADDMSGHWILESTSDNYEALLSALDVGFLKRKAILSLKPEINIKQKDGKFEITMTTNVSESVLRFTVGEEFVIEKHPLIDGSIKTIVNWEDDHLVQRSVDNDKGLVTSRFIDNGKLVVAHKVGNVTARRVFSKSPIKS